MEREIKFRGIDMSYSLKSGYKYNVWRYGSLIQYDNGQAGIVGSADRYGRGLFTNEVIPETIGQFTGLLDKNGKEIYEGDIIVSTTKDFRQRINHNNSPVKGIVKYEAPSFYIDVNGIMGIALDNGFDEHEIIGNIHEGGI